jgi:glycogen debranching enzyme
MSPRLDEQYADVVRNALDVLATNAMGHATRPGGLYPHQWSWDAACIAMGRAQWEQELAEHELRSLFAGQWANGLLPHIVFTDSERYFPGPAFWQTERSPDAPAGVRTSGIVQPPIHATATWRVYQRSADRERATAFLREMLPRLTAWHEYLYRDRTRGDGLVEVWHPWESGNDNAPSWDAALARIELTPEQIPDYQRVDNTIADPAERPSDFDYDRYTYLVALFRELDYDSPRIHEACPFVLQPALYNSLLIESDRDLARIARELGEDPSRYEAWAQQTSAGMEKLWDPARSLYVDYDVRAGTHAEHWGAGSFAPLYAGVPSAERAEGLIERLAELHAPLPGERLWGVATTPPSAPFFNPRLYWRGPIWPLYQWVLGHGAARYGHAELAERLHATAIELARSADLWEHYNASTGEGQGDPEFSWTAGLVLDLLARPLDTAGMGAGRTAPAAGQQDSGTGTSVSTKGESEQ